MRYKDGVKGSANLNMIDGFMKEIGPTDQINIRKDVAEMLLGYVDEALKAQRKHNDVSETACMSTCKIPEIPEVQKPKGNMQEVDDCGAALDIIELNLLTDLVQEQLERTEQDDSYGKQYAFDLMLLNHKLQVEHMKRR